jgi:choline dehydrogenase
MNAELHDLSKPFDILVVGGGSSGAVIASRLSEDGARRVLLIEAGPDKPADEALVQAVRNGNRPAALPGLNWAFPVHIRGDASVSASEQSGQNRDIALRAAGIFEYQAGKVLGGSSSVNTAMALRGAPSDFDEWVSECGNDWAWAGVLPYYRLLEDDPLGPSDLHGRGGPMPIRRERMEELTPLQAGLMESCLSHGFPQTEDHNNPNTTGVGIVPKNVVDGVRISTALAYLAPARGRANLTILADAHVHRLLWKDTATCSGVEVEVAGQLQRILAGKVILCAGAIGTPAIMMRSGIGDPIALGSLDIPVKVALSGVGQGLMEHPVVGIWGIPKSGVCNINEPIRQTLLRFSSRESRQTNDMYICLMAGLDASDMFPNQADGSPAVMAGVTTYFNKSTSRGQVRLASADAHAMPRVSLNCLGERSDIEPLKEGVRLAWDLLQRPGLRSKFDRILAWTDGMIRSDTALEHAVKAFVRPAANVCGSARMGRSPDSGAVVDSTGRVYGVDNLWIGDASIIPTIPSATLNLTCMMIGEKIAAGLRKLA